jgi:hypothetical protein
MDKLSIVKIVLVAISVLFLTIYAHFYPFFYFLAVSNTFYWNLMSKFFVTTITIFLIILVIFVSDFLFSHLQ